MIPLKLKVKNFFSHKESEIDFSKFDSALLIGNTEGDYTKSNGSGKSVIFEAILWGLFNKSRSMMIDDIIKWGEASCFVQVEFAHDEKTYKVSRTRNRISSSSSVELSYLDGAGDWIDISCSTAGGTNKKIEEIIKLDHKTFVNSIYFRQNDISEFAEVEASRKKEILKSIVDISRWDAYEKEARKRAKEITLETNILKKSVEEYDSTYEALSAVQISVEESRLKLEGLREKRDSCAGDISSLGEKYSALKKSLDTDTYDKATEDISNLKKEEATLSKRIVAHKSKLQDLKKERSPLAESAKKISLFLENNKVVEIEANRIGDLKNELSFHKVEKTSAQDLIEQINDMHIPHDECYTCRQAIDADLYNSLISDLSLKESEYLSKVKVASAEILKTDKELNALLKNESNNDKIARAEARLETENYKLAGFDANIEEHSSNLAEVQERWATICERVKKNQDLLDSIKNDGFQALRKHIKILKAERDDLAEEISKENINVGRLLERESNLSKSLNKIKGDKKNIAEKLKKVALFERLGRMFGKSGIQAVLLDTIIADLEKSSNVILSSICNEPVAIVLETQRLGSDGVSTIETLDLKVQKDGYLQSFKSLSGGEQFRISLALRIGLSDMSSRYGGSSLEFLLLDEVNSPLDRYGVETLFMNVIKSLEDKYKILVITHDESLKERFDNVIDVTKVNGESTIKFSVR
jgi:DNA repair protein SbcC/Rad50